MSDRERAYKRAIRNLAVNLRCRRAALRMTQQDVADKAGVHVSTVGAYEHGYENPRVTTIAALAHALECDAEGLLAPVNVPAYEDKLPGNVSSQHSDE